MRILVVNVNTTESITDAIARSAQAVASPGTEIVGLTPYFGADSIEGNFESYLAAIAVMDRVMAYDQPFDALIKAGYGEHGREGLQELRNVPVGDITDAGLVVGAIYTGHKFQAFAVPSQAAPAPQRSNPLDWLLITILISASGVVLYKLQRNYRMGLLGARTRFM